MTNKDTTGTYQENTGGMACCFRCENCYQHSPNETSKKTGTGTLYKDCAEYWRLQNVTNKDTLKERVKTFMTNFDIGQRLFLNGKLHSTNWNKKTEEELLEIIEQTRKETAEEILKECIGDDGLIDRDCAVRDGVGKCLEIIKLMEKENE